MLMDATIAQQAPCACCSGDVCGCDRVALKTKGPVLVVCCCDCTACACSNEALTESACGQATCIVKSAQREAQMHDTAIVETVHQQQQQQDRSCSATSIASNALLPDHTAVLTLEPQHAVNDDPLCDWRGRAALLLHQPDLNIDAVKISRQQGTLQVLLTQRHPIAGQNSQAASGSAPSCADPVHVASKLHELGFKLRAQQTAAMSPNWQKLSKVAGSHTGAVSEAFVQCGSNNGTEAGSSPSCNAAEQGSLAGVADKTLVTLGMPDNDKSLRDATHDVCSSWDSTSGTLNLPAPPAGATAPCCTSSKTSIVAASSSSSSSTCSSPVGQSYDNKLPLATGACASASASAGVDAATEQVLVSVGGMTCSMCAGAVEDVVRQVPGVVSVSVNLATNTATILYHPAATQPQICVQAIEDAGFEAAVEKTPKGPLSCVVVAGNGIDQWPSLFSTVPKVVACMYNQGTWRWRCISDGGLFSVRVCPGLTPDDTQHVLLSVTGMACNSCAAVIEDAVSKVPGVVSVAVDLSSSTAAIVYKPAVTGPRTCIEVIRGAGGFEATLAPTGAGGEGAKHQAGVLAAREAQVWRQRLLWALLLALPVAVLSMITMEPGMQLKLEGPHVQQPMIDSSHHNVMNSSRMDGSNMQLAAINAGTGPAVHGGHHNISGSTVESAAAMSAGGGSDGGDSFLTGTAPGKLVGGLPILWLVQLVLATGVQFGVGHVFYSSAYYSLKHRRPNMAVLVVLGTTAAYVYSIIAMVLSARQPAFMGHVYFESSALIITFVCLGKWIEARAKAKTGDAVAALLGLTPKTALLVVDAVVADQVANAARGAAAGGGNAAAVGSGGKATGLPSARPQNGVLLSADCGVKELPLELIQVGDILKVLPGASIPTDGTLLSGSTSVDESLITGEALPVSKRPGDSLIGGSVNGAGLAFMRVGRVGPDTVLSGIARLVQEAQGNKAAMQVLADKVAVYFVPTIIVLAGITFVTWIIIGYGTNLPASLPSNWSGASSPLLLALLHAISVLVIACPCALGLATPTVAMVAIAVAARHGVLVKGAAVLELAHKVGVAVFDKTGTLTRGKCQLQQVLWLQHGATVAAEDSFQVTNLHLDRVASGSASARGRGSDNGGTGNMTVTVTSTNTPARQQLLQLLAAVEAGSEHPLAKAVAAAASQLQHQTTTATINANTGIAAGATGPALHVEGLEVVPGRGVEAWVPAGWLEVAASATGAAPDSPINSTSKALRGDSVSVLIGNVAWMQDREVPLSQSVRERVAHLEEAAGATVVIGAVGGMAIALLVIGDSLKPEAAAVLRALQQRGVEPWMITGDSRRVATALAKQLQLPCSHVVAEATPAMKARLVQQLRLQQAQKHAPSTTTTTGWQHLNPDIWLSSVVRLRMWMQRGCGSAVAMIGDGINDSPALAEADVGLAVGSGADIAAHSADLLLMKDDLSDVLVALDISSKAYHRMCWNFVYAYGYNMLAIPLAAGVLFPATHSLLPPWIAALAMAASSVSVVCSSLLLRLYRPAKDICRASVAAHGLAE